MIIIFTYNREAMLQQLVAECHKHYAPVEIIDDGSDYEHTPVRGATVHVFEHGGKQKYFERWAYALQLCDESNDEFFLFLPDDYSDIDFDKIRELHGQLKESPYCCKVVNDGRGPHWTTFKEKRFTDELTRIDWLDCSFFCNRSALAAIGFVMFPVSPLRFVRDPLTSSGVGQQLTMRFGTAGIPIYRPIKSLAYHGDHDSVMHSQERKRNPLISI